MKNISKNIKYPSYIGKPKNNSSLYITKKIENLITVLNNVEGCIVFLDNEIEVPIGIIEKHEIIKSKNPAMDFRKYINELYKEMVEINSKRKYKKINNYYIGENVLIGEGTIIEDNVLIDHDVVIGKNCLIKFGSVIRNAIIGDNFICNENATIGGLPFTMTYDINKDLVRIPPFGNVIIYSNVELGRHSDIEQGQFDSTIIKDNVKIDAFVQIGHDSLIEENVEITASSIIGGYSKIGANTFIGMNTVVRNRINIGEETIVGMGSVVTKDLDSKSVYYGNPAKKH